MTLLMRKLKVKRKCNNEQNCLDTEQQYNKSKFLKIKTKNTLGQHQKWKKLFVRNKKEELS